MAVQTARVPASGLLLEREAELGEISHRLAAAEGGDGSALMLEGPPGIGKTALLTTALERARRAGVTTLIARAGELESGLPWGIVRGLFEHELATASTGERRRLFADAAGLARIALRPGDPRSSARADALGAALHGLFWLTANLAARRPLLLAIDDVHWADKPSLRWLAYLAARLEGMPALLLTTVRLGEPGAHSGAISALARAGSSLRLAELSGEASATLAREALGGDADAEVCAACHAATAGNPFLLRCLVDELRGRETLAAAAEEVTRTRSGAISRAVLARLSRLPRVARELASAIAVFGAPCSLYEAAALAGLDDDAAVAGADALAAQHLIADSEPLRFLQPIVRTAVYEEIPHHRGARWHRRAAALLDDADAPTDQIAVHLMAAEPAGDPAVVEVLRSAASAALAAGAPESAVEFLERTLAEPPPASARVAILRELGVAEASLQMPGGTDHLRAALRLSKNASERARIARELAVPLTHSGRVTEAVETLERAADELGARERDLRLRLDADVIAARRLDPALRKPALARVKALRAARLKGRTPGERVALSAVALVVDSHGGTAAESIECARRALGKGRLLAEAGVDSPSFWWAVAALVLADAFEEAQPVVESALAQARSRGSTAGTALGLVVRGLLAFRTGRLADAEADAREAIDIAPSGGWAASVYALVFLIEILLARGRPKDAAGALAHNGLVADAGELLPLLLLRHGRGRLRLALGDANAGLADMRAAASGLEAGSFSVQLWPWRSAHAVAMAAAGESEEALRLADEELRLARAFGARCALGIALRARGLIEPARADVDLLREAVAVLDGSGAVLEHARASIDLGAALRREGRRPESIESLRRGLDLAHRCGAGALTALAREELVAAGAKPRRDALHGRDALTASELRIARMASEGRTNREIAEALFVSLRTVETHLTHAYQKLAIESRDALAGALAAGER